MQPHQTRRTPDAADVLAAGRPYPTRDALAPQDPYAARMLLADRRAWWLDAAQAYLDQAEHGAPGALADAHEALAQSRDWAPAATLAGAAA